MLGQLACYDRQEICKSAGTARASPSWVCRSTWCCCQGGSWPAMDSEASTTPQLSFYAAAAVPPSPVCSTQSQTPRLQLDQFFSQGFVFAPKIALFAQNLCFPMLPCLQMFCLFCINLQLEGFAGNLKEARSFYLWLSSSTLQAG